MRKAEEKKRFLIGSKQVTDYDLSDKGRSTWRADATQPGYGNFCYGHAEATSIDNFTPADNPDATQVSVNYHLAVSGVPDWANAAETKTAFPKIASDTSGAQTATASLQKGDNGWMVTSVLPAPVRRLRPCAVNRIQSPRCRVRVSVVRRRLALAVPRILSAMFQVWRSSFVSTWMVAGLCAAMTAQAASPGTSSTGSPQPGAGAQDAAKSVPTTVSPHAVQLDAEHRPITRGRIVKSGPVIFEDVSEKAGLTKWTYKMGRPAKEYIVETKGSGVGLIDYDNDGWLDIYIVNGSTFDALDGKETPAHAALFHNNHDGTFYPMWRIRPA